MIGIRPPEKYSRKIWSRLTEHSPERQKNVTTQYYWGYAKGESKIPDGLVVREVTEATVSPPETIDPFELLNHHDSVMSILGMYRDYHEAEI